MNVWQGPRTRTGMILCATIVGLALLATLFTALLAAADAGFLDRPIKRWASGKLDRPVTFRTLHLRLLSTKPRIEIEGLSIYNPAWMARGVVVSAARVRVGFQLAAMLRGRLEPTTLAADGLELHLVQLRLGRNNWTFGKDGNGRGFGFLGSVARLSVPNGHVVFVDAQRKLRFRARVSHKDGGSMPLFLSGKGELNGVPFELMARGGRLHRAGVERAYPFVARLIDGATIVNARGTSGDPFDLTTFRLAINARGPNLADLGYLFNLRAPNSAPFRLTTTAEGDGERFTFNPLQVHVGSSDVRGWIRSDHTTERHRATAELWSTAWTKSDVRALLAPLPPRVVARSRSGAVPPDTEGRWILPDTPFPIENLRGLELRARVHIRSLRGYTLPLNQLSARIDLADGMLTYSSVHARVYGGILSGGAALDFHQPTPRLNVAGVIAGIELSQMPARPASRSSGQLTLTARLSGVGRSVHEAASNASGFAMVRIRRGSIPPAAAFILGGDALKALRSMGDVRRPIALDCLSGRFSANAGRFTTDSLAMRTAAGDTVGHGFLDLRDERMSFTLRGEPKQRKSFRLAMPILIQGPVERPSVSVLPAHNAAKLGLKGKLGVALSPLAALLPLGKEASIVARCH